VEKHHAKSIHDLALRAITDLTKILMLAKENGSREEFEGLKRPIGILIGQIETDILGRIYVEHPELDDLQ